MNKHLNHRNHLTCCFQSALWDLHHIWMSIPPNMVWKIVLQPSDPSACLITNYANYECPYLMCILVSEWLITFNNAIVNLSCIGCSHLIRCRPTYHIKCAPKMEGAVRSYWSDYIRNTKGGAPTKTYFLKKQMTKELMVLAFSNGYWTINNVYASINIMEETVYILSSVFNQPCERRKKGDSLICSFGNWLVVWNFFIFHSIWDNPSHWLSYFSRWLKPPTREIYNL